MDRDRSSTIAQQQDMDRERRITIKYFLNKKLQHNGYDEYPLYAKIIINRTNTDVRVPIGKKLFYSERNFNLIKEGLDAEINDIDQNLRDIIRYEYDIKGEDYSVRGLSKRLKSYHEDFILLVYKDIESVDKVFDKTNSYSFNETSLLDKYNMIPSKEKDSLFSKKENTQIATAFYYENFNNDLGKSYLFEWILGSKIQEFSKYINTLPNLMKKITKGENTPVSNISTYEIMSYVNEMIDKIKPM